MRATNEDQPGTEKAQRRTGYFAVRTGWFTELLRTQMPSGTTNSPALQPETPLAFKVEGMVGSEAVGRNCCLIPPSAWFSPSYFLD
jgi:hypothetical protein